MKLSLNDISFSYGRTEALSAITTEFQQGSTVLLGANGAGKSTLLMLIASVMKPRNGSIDLETVGSSDSRGKSLAQYRRAVAWLPQKLNAFPGLSSREQVAYTGWLKGMSRSAAWDASLGALRAVGLEKRLDESVTKLSGGQQRRVAIAGALVHDAQVVLLDEPTAGLDPVQRSKLRDVLAQIANDRIVVVSSHDTEDARGIFARAAVMREGELVFHATYTDFLDSASTNGTDQDRIEAAFMKWAGDEG